jgi:hypothetical protein
VFHTRPVPGSKPISASPVANQRERQSLAQVVPEG